MGEESIHRFDLLWTNCVLIPHMERGPLVEFVGMGVKRREMDAKLIPMIGLVDLKMRYGILP